MPEEEGLGGLEAEVSVALGFSSPLRGLDVLKAVPWPPGAAPTRLGICTGSAGRFPRSLQYLGPYLVALTPFHLHLPSIWGLYWGVL